MATAQQCCLQTLVWTLRNEKLGVFPGVFQSMHSTPKIAGRSQVLGALPLQRFCFRWRLHEINQPAGIYPLQLQLPTRRLWQLQWLQTGFRNPTTSGRWHVHLALHRWSAGPGIRQGTPIAKWGRRCLGAVFGRALCRGGAWEPLGMALHSQGIFEGGWVIENRVYGILPNCHFNKRTMINHESSIFRTIIYWRQAMSPLLVHLCPFSEPYPAMSWAKVRILALFSEGWGKEWQYSKTYRSVSIFKFTFNAPQSCTSDPLVSLLFTSSRSHQRPFQEPKLEVFTIYKAYRRPMKGNIPTKYGLIWCSTSILGSWNSHWSHSPSKAGTMPSSPQQSSGSRCHFCPATGSWTWARTSSVGPSRDPPRRTAARKAASRVRPRSTGWFPWGFQAARRATARAWRDIPCPFSMRRIWTLRIHAFRTRRGLVGQCWTRLTWHFLLWFRMHIEIVGKESLLYISGIFQVFGKGCEYV